MTGPLILRKHFSLWKRASSPGPEADGERDSSFHLLLSCHLPLLYKKKDEASGGRGKRSKKNGSNSPTHPSSSTQDKFHLTMAGKVASRTDQKRPGSHRWEGRGQGSMNGKETHGCHASSIDRDSTVIHSKGAPTTGHTLKSSSSHTDWAHWCLMPTVAMTSIFPMVAGLRLLRTTT